MTASLVNAVSAAATGDRKTAQVEAQRLAQTAVGWFAWTNFYRWVIGTALALLVVFGGFVGSVLLFEQTRKIEAQTSIMQKQEEAMRAQTRLLEVQTERMREQAQQAEMQNELAAVSFVTDLRAQLLANATSLTIRDILQGRVESQMGNPILQSPDNSCRLRFDLSHKVSRAASRSALVVVEDQARDGLVADRMLRALKYLVKDQEASVALSAIMILDALGESYGGEIVNFKNAIVADIELRMPHNLDFSRSVLTNFRCAECTISASNSFVIGVTAKDLGTIWSISDGSEGTQSVSGIVLEAEEAPVREGATYLQPVGVFEGDIGKARITYTGVDACGAVLLLGDTNPVFIPE